MRKLIVFLLTITFLISGQVFSASVAKMDKNELKSLLGSDNLVVLDVRVGRDWNSSEFKIKDAVRMAPSDIEQVNKYQKNTKLVLYCA
jgi:rhodanese-related sulfurtransferase